MKKSNSKMSISIFSVLSLLWVGCVVDLGEEKEVKHLTNFSTEFSSALVQSSSSIEQIACIEKYDPVCAEGKTFSTSCEAENAGYDEYVVGECDSKACTKEYAPVCSQGKTFGNECMAESAGYMDYIEGMCESQVCTTEYAPVCADGKTFSNACGSMAAGYSEYTQGECEVICPMFDAMMLICEEGTYVAQKKDVNGCYSGYECVKSNCELITNEVDCSKKEKCGWDVEMQRENPPMVEEPVEHLVIEKEEMGELQICDFGNEGGNQELRLFVVNEERTFLQPMGSCKYIEVVICPTVGIEEPTCFVGTATPIYVDGCLVDYQCQSN
ncbi:hypothetical protein OAA91_01270 [Fibrobacterales bacterium]|nr:hypothetical protein [Fibrobacterales bacterium]